MLTERVRHSSSKPKRPHWIPVVVGILTKGDEVLLGLRPEGTHLSHMWEFPGGKIEAGESPEQALTRELQEELSIQAEVGELLFSSTHQYKDTCILLLFYRVRFWKGEPKALHHTELKWAPLTSLPQLELPEANRAVLKRIFEHMGQNR